MPATLESPAARVLKSILTVLVLINYTVAPLDYWAWDIMKAFNVELGYAAALLDILLRYAYLYASLLSNITHARHETLYKLAGIYLLLPLLQADILRIGPLASVLTLSIVTGALNGIILQSGINLSLPSEPPSAKLPDMLTLPGALLAKLLINAGLRKLGFSSAHPLSEAQLQRMRQFMGFTVQTELYSVFLQPGLLPPGYISVCGRHGVRLTRSHGAIDGATGTLARNDDAAPDACRWWTLGFPLSAALNALQFYDVSGGLAAISGWALAAAAGLRLGLLSAAEAFVSGSLGIILINAVLCFNLYARLVSVPAVHPIALLTGVSLLGGMYRSLEDYLALRWMRKPAWLLVVAAACMVVYNAGTPEAPLWQRLRAVSFASYVEL